MAWPTRARRPLRQRHRHAAEPEIIAGHAHGNFFRSRAHNDAFRRAYGQPRLFIRRQCDAFGIRKTFLVFQSHRGVEIFARFFGKAAILFTAGVRGLQRGRLFRRKRLRLYAAYRALVRLHGRLPAAIAAGKGHARIVAEKYGARVGIFQAETAAIKHNAFGMAHIEPAGGQFAEVDDFGIQLRVVVQGRNVEIFLRFAAVQNHVDVAEHEVFRLVLFGAANDQAGHIELLAAGRHIDGNVAEQQAAQGAARGAGALLVRTHAETVGGEKERAYDAAHGYGGKHHVFVHGAAARLYFQPVAAVGKHAARDRDIAHVFRRFRAQTDGRPLGFEDAAGNGYALARLPSFGGFEGDGVVAGVDIAAGNDHVLAAVEIDAVAVARLRGQDADARDVHLAHVDAQKTVRSGVLQRDAAQKTAGTVVEHDEERAAALGIAFVREMHAELAAAVDDALALDADILRARRRDECPVLRPRRVAYAAAPQRLAPRVAVRCVIGAGDEAGARFQAEHAAAL